MGDYVGEHHRAFKGDTRSLDPQPLNPILGVIQVDTRSLDPKPYTLYCGLLRGIPGGQTTLMFGVLGLRLRDGGG